MCNYNLFSHPDRLELICAVPEIMPVPSFIAGPPWSFVGCVNDCASLSSGFNHRAAEESVRYNGFYLFQLSNSSDPENWAARTASGRGERDRPVSTARRRRAIQGSPVHAEPRRGGASLKYS
jgi:hypothetical protein